eukprot:TRINITY_DN56177_c0_g1_i1.p1 TRINITY_DN56177_c0_g1~~TRINITY_DN56177_c0_g1_i1.p1  ORF type:complete len:405 (+),score=58.82 TRINITY_DN56177_c0_g1_i1:72-1286(+)
MVPLYLEVGVEVQRDRLYWMPYVPSFDFQDTSEVHYFNIDRLFAYEPLVNDFGPLDLGMTYQYIAFLKEKLSDPDLGGKLLVQYCSHDFAKRANSVYLMCAYTLVVHGLSPEVAFRPFEKMRPLLTDFRDASRGPPSFVLSVLDCLRGLEAGIRLGWFDWQAFDAEDYLEHQKVENGDMNWIIPGKLLAFASPLADSVDSDGYAANTPKDLLPAFKAKAVDVVIRLNESEYDRAEFIDNGIKHADLFFRDGSCPPAEIVDKFLDIIERTEGAVAVHCKAGLGRTGTLIGLYAMKHYSITAREFIAWSRLCRPGSVLGPQQQFLVDMQEEMRQHLHRGGPCLMLQLQKTRVDKARKFAEEGQGQRLVRARRKETNVSRVLKYFQMVICNVGKSSKQVYQTYGMME